MDAMNNFHRLRTTGISFSISFES